MKRVVIIGASIAGSSAALLLSGKADVVVYERKERKDIGKKVCANLVSKSFISILRDIGIKKNRKFFRKKFNEAIFISGNNRLEFPTKCYKINRQAFLDELIDKAKKKGVKFYFGVNFESLRKINRFRLTLRKGKTQINDYADILIGADGALSKVAECSGLKRKSFFSTSEIPVKLNQFKKDAWYVFLKPEFGYYAYFDQEFAGTGCRLGKNLTRYQKNFFSYLRIKNPKHLVAALEPEPDCVKPKQNLFLIGDAGGHVKFNGGGIVPAIRSAIAVRDIILKKDYVLFKKIRLLQFINRLMAKAFERMNEKDWKDLFEILKDKKFQKIIENRDELSVYGNAIMDFRLLRFLPKLL